MKEKYAYTILIVDDNRNNLFTLRSLIEEYVEAAVIEADCGIVALQKLVENDVDLIILDVQMEGMDGFEVASLIKRRKTTKDVPIVFLSAACIGEEFKKRGFEIGAVDYLTKPIDEYQLFNRINVYLKLIEKERNINILLERKVKEQTKKLLKAKEEAEAANEAKNIFLSNISHELRTPLNVLMGTNKMLNIYMEEKSQIDKQKIQEKLDIQTQNCNRLLRLVNNLIDITNIESGYYEMDKKYYNIIDVVESITFHVAQYAEIKDIELIFDTEMEEKVIYCDVRAVERILLNLLSNAIKFTPRGGNICVNIEDLKDMVQISVIDTGIGVKEDYLCRIFERFQQVDDLLTRKQEGSGIGLSLVKALVERQEGKIDAYSEYEKGSKFMIKLPVEFYEEEVIGHYLEYKMNEEIIQTIQLEFSDIYF